ncbi:MAG: rod shape-determining protein MreD [Elusimicrobiaceae bacterium]|nr:rod shape-determining protein MreD [Elusimicrobiaceae bacterium]
MLKTILKLMLLFWAATILHWGCLALLGAWGISVNVMLVFVMAVCACLKPEYGYPTAFICGLFLDFFGVKLFGHNAFVFMWCAVAVYSLEKRVDLEAVVPQVVSAFVLGLLAAVFNGVLLKFFVGLSTWNGWWPFVSAIILTALIAPAIFWAVRRTFPIRTKNY